MAILDGNDLLRKVNVRQGTGASGTNAGIVKADNPVTPGVGVGSTSVIAKPETAAGNDKPDVIKPEMTWADTAVNDYSRYLEQMNQAKQQAAVAELEAAYKQNVAAIDRAEVGVAEEYQKARNQTAAASEQAKRNMAQYAAANGLNSGTGSQAELARNVALMGNLNTIDTAEGQTLADIQLQRANAETEYNSAIAKAKAEGNYELASALYQEKVRVENALLDLAAKKYQMEYQAYRDSVADTQQEFENWFAQLKYGEGKSETERETLAGYGAAMMQAGVMPSAEMLAAMRLGEADAQSFVQTVLDEQNRENQRYADELRQQEWDNTYKQLMNGVEVYVPTDEELAFANYLYSGTKNQDYLYEKLKESGYSDTQIDVLMSKLGL